MRILLTLIALCIGMTCAAQKDFNTLTENSKPFVIPEITAWEGGRGNTTMSGKIAIKGSEALIAAEHLEGGLRLMGVKAKKLHTTEPQDGDVLFVFDQSQQYVPESYKIEISDIITVTASDERGFMWAANTLLQMCEQHVYRQGKKILLPRGVITDEPQYRLRGFLFDVGRKYIPMSYLHKLVEIMSYYKMNTLQLHLNDNGFRNFFSNDWDKTPAAFRLECDTYPGLTARDGSYTKQEFIELQRHADSLGVEIIPEIDAPAHVLAFTRYRPSLGSKEHGMDHFDLSNPDVYTFMDGLWKEYLGGDSPVFTGKRINIGTDEYSNASKELVEQFRKFTDHYLELIESYGRQPAMWGALTHASGDTPVRSRNVLMNCWSNGFAAPDSMKQLGYQIVSIPDWYVYIVPAVNYYHDYLDTENLYNNWTPAVVGNVRFSEQDPQLEGGMFALWNDHVGNGISVKDIHHRLFPAMQTISTKCWTGVKTTLPYSEYESLRPLLSEAPGINECATLPAETVTLKKVKANSVLHLPVSEAGYGSSIEFTVECRPEKAGTIFFKGPNATFYAATPDNSHVGFARDGYNYSFNYSLPAEGKVTLRIETTNAETTLYVNGNKLETLKTEKRGGMSWVQTLVFPLQETGNYNSRISNLTVKKTTGK